MNKIQHATQEVIEGRIDKIITFRLRGWSQSLIVKYCDEHYDWGITKRQIRNYVQQADEILGQEARNTDRRSELELAKRRYEHMFRLAMKDKNIRTAAEMQDRLVALLGLKATDALSMDWEHESREISEADPDRLKAIAKLLFTASDDTLQSVEGLLFKDNHSRLITIGQSDDEA